MAHNAPDFPRFVGVFAAETWGRFVVQVLVPQVQGSGCEVSVCHAGSEEPVDHDRSVVELLLRLLFVEQKHVLDAYCIQENITDSCIVQQLPSNRVVIRVSITYNVQRTELKVLFCFINTVRHKTTHKTPQTDRTRLETREPSDKTGQGKTRKPQDREDKRYTYV